MAYYVFDSIVDDLLSEPDDNNRLIDEEEKFGGASR